VLKCTSGLGDYYLTKFIIELNNGLRNKYNEELTRRGLNGQDDAQLTDALGIVSTLLHVSYDDDLTEKWNVNGCTMAQHFWTTNPTFEYDASMMFGAYQPYRSQLEGSIDLTQLNFDAIFFETRVDLLYVPVPVKHGDCQVAQVIPTYPMIFCKFYALLFFLSTCDVKSIEERLTKEMSNLDEVFLDPIKNAFDNETMVQRDAQYDIYMKMRADVCELFRDIRKATAATAATVSTGEQDEAWFLQFVPDDGRRKVWDECKASSNTCTAKRELNLVHRTTSN
jgi:hypothetical protein